MQGLIYIWNIVELGDGEWEGTYDYDLWKYAKSCSHGYEFLET